MMKHTAGIAAMVFAASAALAAQQAPATAPAAGSQTPPQAARAAQSEPQRQVRVTGCLKPIEAPGTVATTITSNSQFTLTNARVVPTAAAGAADAPSTVPPAAGSASFAVVAENVEELRGQANHHVEITGRLEPMPAGAGAASGAVGTTGTSGAAPAMRLRVDAVKQIAASCPQ